MSPFSSPFFNFSQISFTHIQGNAGQGNYQVGFQSSRHLIDALAQLGNSSKGTMPPMNTKTYGRRSKPTASSDQLQLIDKRTDDELNWFEFDPALEDYSPKAPRKHAN
ncbi:hypothetical protein KY285_030279 [Solanum tuberosum]|nr:hypothetical protein KY289_030410 [Solanum tuberosum]KAH0655397.1 hypothetical protein KY285_030279 [Solanum tuberosum]